MKNLCHKDQIICGLYEELRCLSRRIRSDCFKKIGQYCGQAKAGGKGTIK